MDLVPGVAGNREEAVRRAERPLHLMLDLQPHQRAAIAAQPISASGHDHADRNTLRLTPRLARTGSRHASPEQLLIDRPKPCRRVGRNGRQVRRLQRRARGLHPTGPRLAPPASLRSPGRQDRPVPRSPSGRDARTLERLRRRASVRPAHTAAPSVHAARHAAFRRCARASASSDPLRIGPSQAGHRQCTGRKRRELSEHRLPRLEVGAAARLPAQ